MFINVPKKIKKSDIKFCGEIYKGIDYSYILSDLNNNKKENTIKLNGYGYYNYIFDIYDTYLFVIGNQVRSKNVNLKQVNFIEEILQFEYNLSIKKNMHKFSIPSKCFTITSHERWLQDDFLKEDTKIIQNIIDTQKIHLQGIQQSYVKYMKCLCDETENNIGLFKYGLCKNTLYNDTIYIQKRPKYDAYIIKYDQTDFSC